MVCIHLLLLSSLRKRIRFVVKGEWGVTYRETEACLLWKRNRKGKKFSPCEGFWLILLESDIRGLSKRFWKHRDEVGILEPNNYKRNIFPVLCSPPTISSHKSRKQKNKATPNPTQKQTRWNLEFQLEASSGRREEGREDGNRAGSLLLWHTLLTTLTFLGV